MRTVNSSQSLRVLENIKEFSFCPEGNGKPLETFKEENELTSDGILEKSPWLQLEKQTGRK